MRFVTNTPGRVVLIPERIDGKRVECLMTDFEPLVYDAICDILQDGARCAEIGSFRGGSACVFSHGMKRRGKNFVLACHDVFENFVVDGETHDIEKEFDEAIAEWGYETNVHKVKGDSKNTHNIHADNSLDYVFIDGDHSYEGALADIKNFSRALKPGGWLLVQDSQTEVLDAITDIFGDTVRLKLDPPVAHYLTVFNSDAGSLERLSGHVNSVLKKFENVEIRNVPTDFGPVAVVSHLSL
jgi:SAM-dependent methyltransferase